MVGPTGSHDGPQAMAQRIFAIERPSPRLMVYYAAASLLAGPFFWIPLVPRFFRYRTLRYKFDEEGISMRWGILFRREIHLTYSRIQDIHLRSNVVERWLGLARIEIQTASGSARAEMVIEGLPEAAEIRDFIYTRMRGWRERRAERGSALPSASQAPDAAAELISALREAADALRAVRQALGGRPTGA